MPVAFLLDQGSHTTRLFPVEVESGGSSSRTVATTLPGSCRLQVRRQGKGKAIAIAETGPSTNQVEIDPPIIINEGDLYKLELCQGR